MKSILTILFIAVFFGCSHSPAGVDNITSNLPVYSFPEYGLTMQYVTYTMTIMRYSYIHHGSLLFYVYCDYGGNWHGERTINGTHIIITDSFQLARIAEMQKINYELFRDFPGQMHFIDSTLFW